MLRLLIDGLLTQQIPPPWEPTGHGDWEISSREEVTDADELNSPSIRVPLEREEGVPPKREEVPPEEKSPSKETSPPREMDQSSPEAKEQSPPKEKVKINPLSPNIHVQILQTDLYTFP